VHDLQITCSGLTAGLLLSNSSKCFQASVRLRHCR